MSETNNKLEIKNLSKRFGEKTLFENLLTVDGPAVLWAPSGWGKTTLLRILMGLEAPHLRQRGGRGPGRRCLFRRIGSAPADRRAERGAGADRRKVQGQKHNTKSRYETILYN